MRHTLKGLADIEKVDGGLVDAMFSDKLQKMLADIKDRPAVKGPRKVTLTVIMAPTVDQQGSSFEVDTRFEVKAAAPSEQTRRYSMAAIGTEGLVHNDLSPDSVNQMTLDEERTR